MTFVVSCFVDLDNTYFGGAVKMNEALKHIFCQVEAYLKMTQSTSTWQHSQEAVYARTT